MSEFVNYNKRNVTLPEGCKDLADVLQRKARRKIPWLKLTRTIVQPAEVTTEHKIRGRLGEIGIHVACVYFSRAQLVGLSVRRPSDPFSLEIFRLEGQDVTAYVTFGNDPEREQAVRGFFAAHSLRIPPERGIADNPFLTTFLENSFALVPMPCEPQMLAKIAADFFTEVCEADNSSQLEFYFFETSFNG